MSVFKDTSLEKRFFFLGPPELTLGSGSFYDQTQSLKLHFKAKYKVSFRYQFTFFNLQARKLAATMSPTLRHPPDRLPS